MHNDEKDKLVNLLRKYQNHSFLATLDGDQPYIRPMSPFTTDDLVIYMATFRGSRKEKQIQNHSRICLLFADVLEWTQQIIVYGDAFLTDSVDEKIQVWNARADDLVKYFPGGYKSPQFSLLKVKISRIEYYEGIGQEMRTYIP
jgi:general stress protein 26